MNMHGLIITLNEPTNCMRSECCVGVLDKTCGELQGDPLRQTPFMMNKKKKMRMKLALFEVGSKKNSCLMIFTSTLSVIVVEVLKLKFAELDNYKKEGMPNKYHCVVSDE